MVLQNEICNACKLDGACVFAEYDTNGNVLHCRLGDVVREKEKMLRKKDPQYSRVERLKRYMDALPEETHAAMERIVDIQMQISFVRLGVYGMQFDSENVEESVSEDDFEILVNVLETGVQSGKFVKLVDGEGKTWYARSD